MERKFSDIQLEESYQQCHKGQFFLVEEKRFGKMFMQVIRLWGLILI